MIEILEFVGEIVDKVPVKIQPTEPSEPYPYDNRNTDIDISATEVNDDN